MVTAANCVPCPTESTGDGPVIVSASKYVSVKDITGNDCALRPKKNAILHNRGSGKNPVVWADGSNDTENKINLKELKGTAGSGFTNIVGQDSSGFLMKAFPDQTKGKQLLVASGGAMGWEAYGANRHCFPGTQIKEQDGANCPVAIAAFSVCGPDGQICLIKLPVNSCGSLKADGTVEETNPAGVVVMFAGVPVAVPDGYLLCDGRSVSTATYPSLFTNMGYSFGGAGASMNLPDMRGKFPRGADTVAGTYDPDVATRIASAPGGNSAENVGSFQEDALQCHEHEGGVLTITDGAVSLFGIGNPFVRTAVQGDDAITQGQCMDVPLVSRETRPVNLYFNFIISVGC